MHLNVKIHFISGFLLSRVENMVKEYCRLFIGFIKKYYIPLLIFAIYAIGTAVFSIPNCLVKLAIGFPCPGCGLTRATLSLLRFDFVQAFMYNPLIFIVPPIAWILIFHERPILNKIYKSTFFWIVLCVIVLIVYILRIIYVYPNAPMDYHEDNLFNLIKSLFIKD